MKKSLFVLFPVLLAGSLATAASVQASCNPNSPPVRVDQKGGVLEHAPVFDQGFVPGCYAATASLLVQAVTKGHPRISYLDIFGAWWDRAAKNPINSGLRALRYPDFGNTCSAFNLIQDRGFCGVAPDELEALAPRHASLLLEKARVYFDVYQFGMNAVERKRWTKTLSAHREYLLTLSRETGALIFLQGKARNAYTRYTETLDGAEYKRALGAPQAALMAYFSGPYLDDAIEIARTVPPAEQTKAILERTRAGLLALGAPKRVITETIDQIGKLEFSRIRDDLRLAEHHQRLSRLENDARGRCPKCFDLRTTEGKAFDAVQETAKILWELPPALRPQQMNHSLDVMISDAASPDGVRLALKSVLPGCADSTQLLKTDESTVCIADTLGVTALEQKMPPQKVAALFQSKVVSRLDSGFPIGISYCQQTLVDPNFDGKYMSACANSGHGSVIIGYRWRGDSCEYLLHNSFGTDCKAYEKLGPGACEGGKIWVKEAHLVRNTHEIEVIEPKTAVSSPQSSSAPQKTSVTRPAR